MPQRMRLDEIRRARKFSQEFMAKQMGVSRSTYIKMETNPQNITMEQAANLAKILNVDVDDIIFFETESTKCR